MNVSMADAYNLGWKLVAVLQGRSPASLLHTYHLERHDIAEDLVAMDKRWSKAIGAAQVDLSNPRAALIGLAEVQRQFVTNLDFTAGLATNYAAGPLTGDDTHLHLAAGYEPGRRFHSAEVIRLSDAKRLHLGHVHAADARWRLYAFADAVDPRNPASRLNTLMDFLAGPNSPVAKYTPEGWDTHSVFDVRAIIQQLHQELDWMEMHEFLKPTTGPLGLIDYEKVFCPLPDTDQDVFDLRRIDRGSGALVVVRPDQYVALTLPLDGFDELGQFFARFMNPA
jgi:phenol 2-monooxygenase